MNAAEFYEEFKEALKYLGPGWTDMSLVELSATDGQINMSYGNLSVSIKVGEPT